MIKNEVKFAMEYEGISKEFHALSLKQTIAKAPRLRGFFVRKAKLLKEYEGISKEFRALSLKQTIAKAPRLRGFFVRKSKLLKEYEGISKEFHALSRKIRQSPSQSGLGVVGIAPIPRQLVLV